LLAVVAPTACTPPSSGPTVETYFPIAVGNRWCWTAEDDATDSTQWVITGSSTWNSKRVYAYMDSINSDAGWLVPGDSELRWYEVQLSDTARYTVLLRKPFEIGTNWLTAPPDTLDTLRIADNDVLVIVPAGTFEHCLRVVDDAASYAYYFAPEVGIVKYGDEEAPDLRVLSSYRVH
jgi:hypothetical protein